MHLIRFRHQSSIRYGILSAQSVTPIRGTGLAEAVKGEADITHGFVFGESSRLGGPQFGVGRPWAARVHAINGEILGCGDVSSEETKIGTIFFADP